MLGAEESQIFFSDFTVLVYSEYVLWKATHKSEPEIHTYIFQIYLILWPEGNYMQF